MRRELRGHAELDAQVVEAAPHEHVDRLTLRLLRRAGVQLDMASGHAVSLGAARPGCLPGAHRRGAEGVGFEPTRTGLSRSNGF
ncbi:hypothetical protein CXY01_29100 [Cellulomonas xylanilytica]|uniref:Uncharacterized protein n=1 Tax=Cellulomonas xylanilytica TaxID=233583 RepID=A0A510VAW1_9CELL|nr:hypothetical protein CXY01_29100 [Cellulomonas xylanilytica]